jgi:hypothetical protein
MDVHLRSFFGIAGRIDGMKVYGWSIISAFLFFAGLSRAETVTLVADTTPTGTVMAFNLSSCPDGWKAYVPSHGRWVSGYDSANPSVGVSSTSSGTNPVFEAILDLFSSNIGSSTDPGAGAKLGVSASSGPAKGRIYDTSDVARVHLTIDDKSLPPSVTLLYCRKE